MNKILSIALGGFVAALLSLPSAAVADEAVTCGGTGVGDVWPPSPKLCNGGRDSQWPGRDSQWPG